MRTAATAIIGLTLLLQGFWVVPGRLRSSVLSKLGGKPLVEALRPPLTYPFLDYPMYSRARRHAEPVSRLSLVGILRDGEQRPLPAEQLGLTPWHYFDLLRAVLQEDTEEVYACLASADPSLSDALVALRVEDEPLLWGDGPVRVGARTQVATLTLVEP